jgi:hypothetical protein
MLFYTSLHHFSATTTTPITNKNSRIEIQEIIAKYDMNHKDDDDDDGLDNDESIEDEDEEDQTDDNDDAAEEDRFRTSKIIATPKPTIRKRISLMDIASRILPLQPEDTNDEDDEDTDMDRRKRQQKPSNVQEDEEDQEDVEVTISEAKGTFKKSSTEKENTEKAGTQQELERSKATTSVAATKQNIPSSGTVTDWKSHFDSPKCVKFRNLPPGHANEGNVGQGQRSLCTRNSTERRTVEFKTELGGSIDISFIHKTIYIPVMKAGSQMFQEVFRRRLRGKRIFDRQLNWYLKKFDFNLEDFFVFTFVRDPLKTFVSAYGEVSKYAARNRTIVRGFAQIDDTPENEPSRSMACLENIKRGTFHGLVPAHMHTQLWKVSRCLSDTKEKTDLPINFIGHLENLDQDWRYVEQVLNIPHQELPVIHSSSQIKTTPKRSLQFDAPSSNERFSPLTKQVCEYYKSDFACFGYDDSICNQ